MEGENKSSELPIIGPQEITTTSGISGESARIKFLNNVVIGILVVLFLGFAGMFIATGALMIDSFRSKQATYQSLVDKVNEQNNKIDTLVNISKPVGISGNKGN